METTYLSIREMYCSACATRIEKVVSRMDGVIHITVNLATETGRVTFHEKKIRVTEIIDKIKAIGFEATIATKDRDQTDKTKEIQRLWQRFLCSAILTIPLAWAMLAHFQWATFIYIPPIFMNPFFQFIITIPIQFIIGFPFYERAWKAIRNGSTNMDVLVVLSTSAAFFYSQYVTFTMPDFLSTTESVVLYYETSAFIITFILLGRLLETQTKLKTTEALEKLYQIQTKTAHLYKNGIDVPVAVEQLVPGDQIRVKPGEKVPIDGLVIEGISMIDESLLTGESIPVEKNVDTLVYAGTINQQSMLKIKVTKKESETVLSNIIHIVEDAQRSKAPIQHIADEITSVFVPIVIMIAVVTFLSWYFVFQPGYFSGALGKVIAVLIIACPCALGLATPTSIMVGSGRAAEYGILFKEGRYLERLGKSNYVLLDKTGTITKGIPQVTDLFIHQWNRKSFMELIGAVEQTSQHPVAKAVSDRVKTEINWLPEAQHVENIPGYGVKAQVNKRAVLIANRAYYKENHIKLPGEALQLEGKYKREGKTVMIVSIDHRFAGVIAVIDEIKESSRSAVSRLKKMGLSTILLTGDHQQAGLAVAHKMGIDKVYTECTPSDKAAIVRQFQKEGHHAVMVGDGINDAPALAVAHVGVAIGTGSDIAIESGDVTIITGDLNRLVIAMNISKKTMTNIKQNFMWAFLYNVVMIPFAMFGILVPWVAGAAMAFSSLSVVLNALRLKWVTV